MHIAFIHPHEAFLPGLQAYKKLLPQLGFSLSEHRFAWDAPAHTSVFWYFMGLHPKLHPVEINKIIVHEYASRSVPPFAKWKDFLKKNRNCKPHFRLFTDPYVQQYFQKDDQTPQALRPLGIDAAFFEAQKKRLAQEVSGFKYPFDFIYVGSLHPHRKPEQLLNWLLQPSLSGTTTLLVGDAPEKLRKQYRKYPQLAFFPPQTPDLIPDLLLQARFALNFIPSKAPFCFQPSTKFLEYAAAGNQILSTPTPWLHQFQSTYGGAFFPLHLEQEVSLHTLENFSFQNPDLSALTWENALNQSGIIPWLWQQEKQIKKF